MGCPHPPVQPVYQSKLFTREGFVFQDNFFSRSFQPNLQHPHLEGAKHNPQPPLSLPPYYRSEIWWGCSRCCMHKYNVIGHRGDGTFSAVLKAECKSTGRLVAIKCMKNRFESVEQVNRLREIQALRRLSPHPNITKLYEVLYDRSTGRLALVFEHMSMDLYELIKTRTSHFPEEKVLPLMHQVCRAVHHMHKSGIFHRDLKPENILVTGMSLFFLTKTPCWQF